MRMRNILKDQVRLAIKDRAGTVSGVDVEIVSLRDAIVKMSSKILILEERASNLTKLYTEGFTLDMTIHHALSLNDGVQILFEEMGLKGCKDCPVGNDETLGEAAQGMGVTKAVLLSRLQELI